MSVWSGDGLNSFRSVPFRWARAGIWLKPNRAIVWHHAINALSQEGDNGTELLVG
jgi:hypothetical protein